MRVRSRSRYHGLHDANAPIVAKYNTLRQFEAVRMYDAKPLKLLPFGSYAVATRLGMISALGNGRDHRR